METEKKVIPMSKARRICIKYDLFTRGSSFQYSKFLLQCDNGIDKYACGLILDYMSDVSSEVHNNAMDELFAD